MHLPELKILFDAIKKGYSIQALVSLGFTSLFDNPILLLNTSFQVLDMKADQDFHDQVWNHAKKEGYCSLSSIASFNDDICANQILEEKKTFIYDWNLGHKTPRILSKIEYNKHTYGYLVIFAVNHPFVAKDLELATMFSDTLSITMRSMKEDYFEMTLGQQFIMRLITTGKAHYEDLKNEMAQMGLQFKSFLMCFVIKVMPNNRKQDELTYLRSEVDHLSPYLRSVILEDQLILVYDYNQTKELEIILSQIETLLEKKSAFAGISQSFGDMIYLYNYYEQAKKTLNIGMTAYKQNISDQKKVSAIFHFKDYLLNHLISYVPTNQLECMLTTQYTSLKTYDAQHQSFFCDTLSVYYYSNFNRQETASKLQIHRNTLGYRLSKIAELLDISLDDILFFEQFIISQHIDIWLHKPH